MQPAHPTRDQARLDDAIFFVTVVLVVVAVFQFMTGYWDKFLDVAVAWFPFWHWGG